MTRLGTWTSPRTKCRASCVDIFLALSREDVNRRP